MSTKMLATARLDQHLAMTQQLRQAISLLQYNSLELKQLVQQFLEMNPLIEAEEDDPAENLSDIENQSYEPYQYTASLSKKSAIYTDDENSLENIAIKKDLRSHLLDQTFLCRFNAKQQFLAEAIIDALDENGYMTMTLEDIQKMVPKDFQATPEDILDVLRTVQTFDPLGVGARNVRECLLIQLESQSEKDNAWDVAYKIIDNFFTEDATYNVKQMMKQLKISTIEYTEAMLKIKMLNPHPGKQFSGDENILIEPELQIRRINNEWRVLLADSVLTNIKINKQYQSLIKDNKKDNAYSSLRKELEEAQWLIKGLQRRNETLLKVATYIMILQNDFLDKGKEYLKPMNIIDVASGLNLHESTVSRVTTGKYIATPHGVFELKYFFPSQVITKTGDYSSATAVQLLIKEIIQQETKDHIYSDNEIVEILKTKGITIARRTVTKYREGMNILASYQRQIQHGILPNVAGTDEILA